VAVVSSIVIVISPVEESNVAERKSSLVPSESEMYSSGSPQALSGGPL
jgi:hypothetical protein